MKMQAVTPHCNVSPCAALHAWAILAQNEEEEEVLASLYRMSMTGEDVIITCGRVEITLKVNGVDDLRNCHTK